MSNLIQKGIITIRLKKVTPIMKALFANYQQTSLHENSNEWILGIKPDDTDPRDPWKPVYAAIEQFCEELGCKPEAKTSIEVLLIGLGYHLSQQKEKKKSAPSISFPAVLNQINRVSFKPLLYLDDLFKLALVFDDGHGIEEIKAGSVEFKDQTAHPENYCGFGHYISRNISYWQDSYHALDQGCKIDAALSKNRMDEAASYLSSDLNYILCGVTDPFQRNQLRKLIAESLAVDNE